MAITKVQLVENVQHEVGFSRNDSVEIIETLLELIKHSLEQGDDVMISNFGKFRVREKEARRGRNPATGESLILDPRRVVTFKCSGKLRDLVNNGNGKKKKKRVAKGLRVK